MNLLGYYITSAACAAGMGRCGLAAVHANWDIPGAALIALGGYLLYISTVAYRNANRPLEEVL